MITCTSCQGVGEYDIGDPEDGVLAICPECEGSGLVEEGDVFLPDRDAWKAGD